MNVMNREWDQGEEDCQWEGKGQEWVKKTERD